MSQINIYIQGLSPKLQTYIFNYILYVSTLVTHKFVIVNGQNFCLQICSLLLPCLSEWYTQYPNINLNTKLPKSEIQDCILDSPLTHILSDLLILFTKYFSPPLVLNHFRPWSAFALIMIVVSVCNLFNYFFHSHSVCTQYLVIFLKCKSDHDTLLLKILQLFFPIPHPLSKSSGWNSLPWVR